MCRLKLLIDTKTRNKYGVDDYVPNLLSRDIHVPAEVVLAACECVRIRHYLIADNARVTRKIELNGVHSKIY